MGDTMKKEIRRPRGSSPLILLLGLCLGWTAWAGGEGEHEAGPEPGELPQEVLGDSPPSDPFQDTADLRRAREAIYGQTLSEDQHRRIEGWKVMDSTWWLDPTRRTESSSLRDSIRQMLDETELPPPIGVVEGTDVLV